MSSPDRSSASHRHVDHDKPQLGDNPSTEPAPDLARETPEVSLRPGIRRYPDPREPVDVPKLNIARSPDVDVALLPAELLPESWSCPGDKNAPKSCQSTLGLTVHLLKNLHLFYVGLFP